MLDLGYYAVPSKSILTTRSVFALTVRIYSSLFTNTKWGADLAINGNTNGKANSQLAAPRAYYIPARFIALSHMCFSHAHTTCIHAVRVCACCGHAIAWPSEARKLICNSGTCRKPGADSHRIHLWWGYLGRSPAFCNGAAVLPSALFEQLLAASHCIHKHPVSTELCCPRQIYSSV
jgi:hypothetical protein